MTRLISLAAALMLAAATAGCTQSTGSVDMLTTSYAPAARHAAGPAPCAPIDQSLVGVYGLDGIPEVDSEFYLHADGRFEFFLTIEEFEQHGEGCWSVRGDRLHLVPEGRSAAEFYHVLSEDGFDGLVLTVERSTLLWELEGDLRGAFRRI